MRQLKITKQVTNRETESLNKYLQEVSKLSLITADEEVELTQRIKQGDERALHILVKSNLRFVVSVAKQYQNRGLNLSDLINEGNIGLVKAAKRFDETRGFKFISYAVWWIRQSILQALAEHSRVVRLPLNKIGSIQKLSKASASLEQDLQRLPTAQELADLSDLSVSQVKSSLKNAQRHSSMDAPLKQGETFSLYDVVRHEESPNPEQGLMQESLEIQIERTLETIPQKDATILKLHFGLGGEPAMSLNEIGELFDLSRERVRQIKEKALRQLKKPTRSNHLKAYLG